MSEDSRQATVTPSANEQVSASVIPLSTSTTVRQGFGLGALITTGVISTIAAFSGVLLYFHYFPQTRETPPPIAVVDIVKLATSITKMSMTNPSYDNKEALAQAGESIARLKEAGYIVFDARYVIATPESYSFAPADLVPGLPPVDSLAGVGGYVRPMLDAIPAETGGVTP